MKWDCGISQFLFRWGKEPIVPNKFWWDSLGTDLPTHQGLGHKYLARTLALVIPCFKEKMIAGRRKCEKVTVSPPVIPSLPIPTF